MGGKDKSAIHASYYLTEITFLIIGIIVIGIFGCTLILLIQNHTAMAQEPNGTSFQMDNMTFSHNMASVNGIQLLEDMVILLSCYMDGQKRGMNGVMSCQP